MREPDKKYLPVIASVEVPGPFEIESETARFGVRVSVATQPVGQDAIKIVWEINTLLPAPNSYRTLTSAFAGKSDNLAGMSFRVMASRNGKEFEEVGKVTGPVNSFVHKGVEPNRVYYYKVVAVDAEGTEYAESEVTLGAAGRNLMTFSNFENLGAGPMPDPMPEGASVSVPKAFSIEEGSRPWSGGKHVLKADAAKGDTSVVNLYDVPAPVTQGKAYLHGGWMRSPGPRPVMLGRKYVAEDSGEAFYAHSLGLSNNPDWVFAVQLVTCDPESKTTVPTAMASFWKWPKAASEMSVRIMAYGQAELDDLWVIEVDPPEGTSE